jgi:undecaprenyl-diphosphatase
MLGLVEAIILGLVQGITEWLPISSSGHLAIMQRALGIDRPLFFDALLHVATATVVGFQYRKDLLAIVKAAAKFDFASADGRLGILVLAGTIPTAALGIALRSFFEFSFANLLVIGAGFLFSAFLLRASKEKTGSARLNLRHAVLIGTMQGIAVTPGISRSGATISTGLLLGVDRMEAARYSLLLLIPASVGALILEAGQATVTSVTPSIVGMIVAAIVGYASIRLLLRVVKAGRLYSFMYYCACVGLLTILWSSNL